MFSFGIFVDALKSCDIITQEYNEINTAIKNGQVPDIWKTATITPVPKEYPAPYMDKLRGISGLFTESKIAEKIIAEYIIHDMKVNLDTSQYANQPGVSAQHYLIKMVDKI